ncbi:MAG: UDP-N-acetylmuramoyl-L-alanine--D-glutamate ligase, partial [Chloroflexia bacterium]|nr:UDP-N-acetylmuramoyl-L-alanine--D-glutamate ligase [Chloroflexia bacterium]
IETPISLFIKNYNKPFIGITGTKGKSYTTALVSHLLSALGIENIAAGNNCISPLDYIEEDLEFVLELSSWQLFDMGIQKVSPAIACWLNFFPDHMNYYSSVNEYFNDKSQILVNQIESDFCIVPYGYTNIKTIAKCTNKTFYSRSDLSFVSLRRNESACYIQSDMIFYKDNNICEEIGNIIDLKSIYAEHQLELVLASVCITITYLRRNNFTLNNDILAIILEGIKAFKGLEHRFETIYNSGKLLVINDSAASTPESTIKAIESIGNELILITGGGGHKNLDYSQLAKKILQMDIQTILFANDEPSEILIKLFNQYKYTNYTIVRDLKMAVKIAYDMTVEDSEKTIILFSPACSGYPMYTDMFVRGIMFKQAVIHQFEKNN